MKFVAIAIFVLTLLVSGSYVYSQRNARNSFGEFCTTRVYGWPFPTRIENCECDGHGGLTEFPPHARLWNAGAVLIFSMVAAGGSCLVVRFCR
jgi:hypothetical protein